MELHITRKQAENQKFLESQMRFAERMGIELFVDYEIEKPKPYDCVLWLDENDDHSHGEFNRKADALKWAKDQLAKYPQGIIDLKKWNAKGDDYEDWQYRIVDGEFAEVDGF